MTAMNEERAAIEAAYASVADGGWDSVKDMGIQMFKAGASWQREQGAVPDVSAMAKALSDRVADARCVDPDDNWKIYRHEFIEDVQEDLHVWRATTQFGETCHFGEASTARAWAGENGTVERVDLTPVPELRVVERQEQGDVQRLREALDHIVGLSRALRVGGPDPMDLEGLSNALEEAVDTAHAALAACAAPEVEK